MSVDLAGLGDIFDEWGISSDFLEGLEKTETIWQGRDVVILSTEGDENEIFEQEQIAFAVVQELLQNDAMVHALSEREVAHLLPLEAVFPDLEEEIMFASGWGVDPNKEFMLANADSQNKALPCGLRKFWKKHKTAILITAGAIVVVAGGTLAVVLLWPSAGSTVAGIGGSVVAGLANGDSSPQNPSSSFPNNPHSSPGNSPEISSTYIPPPSPSSEKLEPPKNSYGNTFTPVSSPLVDFHSMPLSSQLSPLGFQPFPPYSFSENKAPLYLNNQPPNSTEFCKEFQDIALQNNIPLSSGINNNSLPSEVNSNFEAEITQQAPTVKGWDEKTWGEKAKATGSHLAHTVFDEVTDIIKIVPVLCEEINDLGSKILPEDPSSSNFLNNGSPVENFENFVAEGHEVIDQIFSTTQAQWHTPEARVHDPANQLTLGILPPPGGGTAQSQGTKFKQAGQLEGALQQELNYLSLPMQESIKVFESAQEFLKPYKDFMPEVRVRELIHQTGIPTFARPIGIPENFKIGLSDRGVGMEYVHPTNNHFRVRVMPGKPHSPFPHQQKPYVIQMKDGKALDKFGNKVDKKSPEAHIPFDEFIYRD